MLDNFFDSPGCFGLGIVAIIVLVIVLAVKDSEQEKDWLTEHNRQCAEWREHVSTPFEITQVRMACENIAASHRAERAAQTAAAMAAMASAQASARNSYISK